ncbi:MAG: hypothetical protein C0518_06830 [Opitutus sp.]|nr:hypothetical protein [Opitutus sp.]
MGTTFVSARSGERRPLDFQRLAEVLAVAPEVLFSMSERSFYLQLTDTERLSRRRIAIAPWAVTPGYPVYSPAALHRSPHIRLGWLRPDALVDPTSETLFLRHCFDCGVELATVNWSHALTLCPECLAPLAAGPQVKAPASLAKFTSSFAAKIQHQYRWKPVNFFSDTMVRAAAVWHVASLFDTRPDLGAFVAKVAEESGFGPIPARSEETADAAAAAALRYALLFAAADFACDNYPEISLRFERLAHYPNNLHRAPSAIEKGIADAMLKI